MIWLASIPSPAGDALRVGPLQLRAYGLTIAVAAIMAVGIARRRWVARGGTADDIGAVAVWAVPAGLVGARMYHVVTDWRRFEGRWLEVLAVWKGGLGIPGGLVAGVCVGAWAAHRRGLPVPALLDVVAPAIPVSQAIGRLGNWFNQELFGRPTDLPWGLEIDPENRPFRFRDVATFHPTFAYEALWNLALAAVLVLVERHRRLRPGATLRRLRGGLRAGAPVGRGPPGRPGQRAMGPAHQHLDQRRGLGGCPRRAGCVGRPFLVCTGRSRASRRLRRRDSHGSGTVAAVTGTVSTANPSPEWMTSERRG